jgi:riboflavin kinase / FMN adenylyltransferase
VPLFSTCITAKVYRTSYARRSIPVDSGLKRVVALGSFDGYHSGHKTLLEKVTENTSALWATGAQVSSAILTFYPHPARALKKGFTDWPIQRLKQRLAIVSRYNIDELFCCLFDSHLGSVEAEEFCKKVLIDQLNVTNLVVGPDAGLGKNRAGDVTFLREFLSRHGATLDVLPYYTDNSIKVGSRQIRCHLADGSINEANSLLGDDPYTLCGRVIHGDKRGRLLEYPTLNLRPGRQLVPKKGVYSGTVTLPDGVYQSVINIGTRPTFGGVELICEAHVYSPEVGNKVMLGDRYGSQIQIELSNYLRDELRFESKDELIKQLSSDVSRARQILNGVK